MEITFEMRSENRENSVQNPSRERQNDLVDKHNEHNAFHKKLLKVVFR